MNLTFLDLFAGAGGLSEGFIQAGYAPIAHVEMDAAACNTLRTRAIFHSLKHTEEGRRLYSSYLQGNLSRIDFYKHPLVNQSAIDSVIQAAIGESTINGIFNKIDALTQEKEIDIVIGGPPCQAYSVVGRSRVGENIKEDPRNFLFKYYVQFLSRYKPKFFVFENVTGLFSAKDKNGNRFYEKVLNALNNAGYRIVETLFHAENYGIPQRRRRVILVGIRSDLPYTAPSFTEKGKCPIPINKLFADLKKLNEGKGHIRGDGRIKGKKPEAWLIQQQIADYEYPVTHHQARPVNSHDQEIYKMVVEVWNDCGERFNYATDLPEVMQTHKNRKSFLDRFKVVDGNSHASQTVVAHISKDGHYYIHPDIKQNRSLTPREAARLQTFPDNYFFESASTKDGRAAAFRQIGNAVPVMLARIIAEELKSILEAK